MSAEMKGAWIDVVNRGMLNREEPGTDRATITTLAHRWGVSEDRTLVLLSEIATRTEEIQKRENDWALFGVVVVEIEMSRGAWMKLKMETVRNVIEMKPHPLSLIKICCPKVSGQAQKKEHEAHRKQAKRANADMGPMSAQNADMGSMSGGGNADMGAMSVGHYPSLPSIYPLPPEGGGKEGELLNFPTAGNQQPLPAEKAGKQPRKSGPEWMAKKNRKMGVASKRQTKAANTAEMDRIGALFGIAKGNGWNVEEAEAWEKVHELMLPGDFEALEWYYGEARKRYGARNYERQGEHGFYLCRHKATLLNKWRTQVEKALERREKDRHEGDEELRA